MGVLLMLHFLWLDFNKTVSGMDGVSYREVYVRAITWRCARDLHMIVEVLDGRKGVHCYVERVLAFAQI